ncbi:MAG: hypothetical protein FWF63_04270 [Fibromonadales bacterium]|nr:hypothetical protein [Fibromonadales bacterium]
MKKVLSLAFIAAVLLLGCSADGFFDSNTQKVTTRSKVCKVGDKCKPVSSKETCDNLKGELVSRSECSD